VNTYTDYVKPIKIRLAGDPDVDSVILFVLIALLSSLFIVFGVIIKIIAEINSESGYPIEENEKADFYQRVLKNMV